MFKSLKVIIFSMAFSLSVSSCSCISNDIEIYNGSSSYLLVSLDGETYIRVEPEGIGAVSIPYLDVVSIYIRHENRALHENIEYTYRFFPLKETYVRRCSYQLFFHQDKIYAIPVAFNEDVLNYVKFIDDQPIGYPIEPTKR